MAKATTPGARHGSLLRRGSVRLVAIVSLAHSRVKSPWRSRESAGERACSLPREKPAPAGWADFAGDENSAENSEDAGRYFLGDRQGRSRAPKVNSSRG